MTHQESAPPAEHVPVRETEQVEGQGVPCRMDQEASSRRALG